MNNELKDTDIIKHKDDRQNSVTHPRLHESMHLRNILEGKNAFKLICGAGNQNLDEIEKLVAIYSKSGCHFFDLSPDEEVLKAAQKGLDFSVPKGEQKNYHFCISLGTKGDQHIKKAKINMMNCRQCAKCYQSCPQGAINPYFMINEKKCIGCSKCAQICEHKAVEIYSKNQPSNLPFILSQPLVNCIELHASDTDEQEVDQIWEYLNNKFNGMLSICLGREKLSNEQILNRIKRLIKDRAPYTTIIQADGSPMSGGEDNYKTTLQAVAMADIIQKANLPVYMLLSGGTNSKTTELAKLCEVDFNGIAVGSYARKIVKEYIKRDDFFENKEIFNEAVKIAQRLIQSY